MRLTETTFVIFFIALALIAVVHFAAMQLSLYWIYPWFDIPMHFWGGLLIAIGTQTTLFARLTHIPIFRFGFTLAVVLLVGILWEAFEWHAGVSVIVEHYSTFTENFYTIYGFDTGKDMVLDVLGGVAGYGIAQLTNNHLR